MRLLPSDQHLPGLLAVLALMLMLPALVTGWQFDDYQQREQLLAHPGIAGLGPATSSLFTFLDGDPKHTLARIERGELAWWTLPTAQIAFWRPVSGLSHWLDYQLWPEQPGLMHLHSLIWLAGLVVVASRLYQALLGPGLVASLAATLYALDDARGFAAAWIANRNMLCATLFGLLALQAHLHWRRQASPHHLAMSLLWLGLALLSAEAAVAITAYLVAYALWLDPHPPRQRLLSLLPALAVVLVWRSLHTMLGYGIWGTTYLEPSREAWQFTLALVERTPWLLLGQWTPLPAEVSSLFDPALITWLWLAAWVIIAALGWLFIPVLIHDRVARFWATGMLLALIPACAALPANRLLFLIGFGAMGLLAQASKPLLTSKPMGSLDDPAGKPGSAGSSPAVSCMWASHPRSQNAAKDGLPAGSVNQPCVRLRLLHAYLCIQLSFGIVLLPITAYSPALLGGSLATLNQRPSPLELVPQTLIVVAAPSPFALSSLVAVQARGDQPMPSQALMLASGLGGVRVERPDPQTLVLWPMGGYLRGYDGVFRAPWHSPALYETLPLSYVTITVIALTADGRPAGVAFRFHQPLESPQMIWFHWQNRQLVPFRLPAVGTSSRLEPTLP